MLFRSLYEAKAVVRNAANMIFAEATGKYLPVKSATASEMARDFVGDARWLLATSD